MTKGWREPPFFYVWVCGRWVLRRPVIVGRVSSRTRRCGFPKVGALRLPTLGADRRLFSIVGRVSPRTRRCGFPKVGALRLPTLGADRRSFSIVGRVSAAHPPS